MSAIKAVEGVPGWRQPPHPEGTGDAERARATRDENRREWLDKVQAALEEAGPVVGDLAGASNAAEIAEAREKIAAVLAEVDALRAQGQASMAAAVGAIPLSPVADLDAIAAAQLLAERIAADARHSLGAQAKLGQEAVRSVIGKVSPAEKSASRR